MRSRQCFLPAAVARAAGVQARAAELEIVEFRLPRKLFLRVREAEGVRRHYAAPHVSRGSGSSAICGLVSLPRRRELWGPQWRGQLLPRPVDELCLLRMCFVCVGAAQPPYGPVDVGGVNFGSGANAFWPGTGSYSTFGLYANSNAEVLLPEPETLAACVLWERGRRGPNPEL